MHYINPRFTYLLTYRGMMSQSSITQMIPQARP